MQTVSMITVAAMAEVLRFHYEVDGNNFTSAGQASVDVKKNLRLLGVAPDVVRKVSIAMYEGEINMVIHAGGGEADVFVDEEKVQIILEDRGPGIAPARQRELFQPFTRLHANTAKDDLSTGLGLNLARQIIADAGGSLWYEDREGGGARFIVELPTPRD